MPTPLQIALGCNVFCTSLGPPSIGAPLKFPRMAPIGREAMLVSSQDKCPSASPPSEMSPLLVWGLGSGSAVIPELRKGRFVTIFAIDYGPRGVKLALELIQQRPTLYQAYKQGRLEIVLGDFQHHLDAYRRATADKKTRPDSYVHVPIALDRSPELSDLLKAPRI